MSHAAVVAAPPIASPPPPPLHPVRMGLAAARANLVPGVGLWAVGVFILLAYYAWPAAAPVFGWLAAMKAQGGFAFSAVSTGLAGGLLPVLVQRLAPGPDTAARASLRHLPFFVLLWAYRGVEIDAFYRLQAWLFGDAATPDVLASKLLVDAALYTPLWAVPSLVLAYAWRDAGFSVREMRRRMQTQWYRRRVVPVLISNWAVWIPAVCVIYALPLALQIPIQNIVLCMWVLMLAVLTARSNERPDASA